MTSKQSLLSQLEMPQKIESPEISKWEKTVQKHPYFQAAKIIYLKALKENKHFKYNKVLKETAALTADRTVLFEYIVRLESPQKKDQDSQIRTPQTEDLSTIDQTKKALKIGDPLEFNSKETHTFNEWLQLSKIRPVVRDQHRDKPRDQKRDNRGDFAKKITLIDQFLQNNPSIPPVDKEGPLKKREADQIQDKNIMTETLARVYLEQKKYENAIKAYQILILKYPEKSAFFADQIKKIKFLKTNQL